jgi:LacI family transcriptional regulator
MAAAGRERAAPLKSHARITDVARLAGVSTATVDRVLNQRTGVRAITVQRVLKAASELSYLPANDLSKLTAPRRLRLVFLLPVSNKFVRMLGDTVGYANEHWAPFNVKCQVVWIESFNPEVLAKSLLRYGKRADGLAFMALEHPAVREAVQLLAERGVATVTLVSDLSGSRRDAYVGLDNRAAGRTAAYLIGRFIGARAAKVAMIAGSRSYAAHGEREVGFLQIFEEQFPAIQVVGLREGQDDIEKNYRQARALLKQHPDLAGIYNIGGAHEGVARALQEARRQHHVVYIGHGLSSDTRALLIDGTMDAVITQNPQAAISSCIRIFTNLRDRRDPLNGVETPRSQVIFRENLP